MNSLSRRRDITNGDLQPAHGILFEPLRIGPVIAPNRFYQTPYATGFGFRDPVAGAKFREIRAEGGWGVVSTEQTEIHPSTDMAPYFEGRLWNTMISGRLP
jgi:dimethylamine/trimethylamine dehydrogenase